MDNARNLERKSAGGVGLPHPSRGGPDRIEYLERRSEEGGGTSEQTPWWE